jgi:hypothetical protein
MSRNFTDSNADEIDLGDVFNYDKDEAWTCGAFVKFDVIAGDQRSIITKYTTGSDRQLRFESDGSGFIRVLTEGAQRILGANAV